MNFKGRIDRNVANISCQIIRRTLPAAVSLLFKQNDLFDVILLLIFLDHRLYCQKGELKQRILEGVRRRISKALLNVLRA